MISARSLRVDYENVTAVRDMDIEVRAGEIYGLVGPNGAGKTSTIKALAGIIEPTYGEVTLAGTDMELDPEAAWRQPRHLPALRPGMLFSLAAVFAALFAASFRGRAGAFAGEEAWRLLGPFRSETRCLAVDPRDPDIVYAARVAFVLRSSDGGRTWSAGSEGFGEAHPHFEGLVVEPGACATAGSSSRAERVSSGSSRTAGEPAVAHAVYTVYAGTGRGVFRSSDSGATWACVNESFRVVGDFVRGPGAGKAGKGGTGGTGVFYSWRGEQLYISTDRCLTWRKLAEAQSSFTFLRACPGERGLMLAGIMSRVGVSRDGGRTWECSRPDDSHPGSVRAVARSAEFPRVLYAGTYFGGTAHGNLYRSPDFGRTWSRVETLPEEDALGRGVQVYSIRTARGRPSTVIVGTRAGVFAGRDDGGTLRLGGEARLPRRMVLDLAVASADRVYAATDNGVYVSRDLGRTWSVSFRGYPTQDVQRVAVLPGPEGRVLAARPGTLYVYPEAGGWEILKRKSWAIALGGEKGDVIFAQEHSALKMSSDLGATWQDCGLGPLVPRNFYMTDIGYGSGHLYVVGLHGTVLHSSDDGRTWRAASLGPGRRYQACTVAVDPEDGRRAYVGLCPPGGYGGMGREPVTGRIAVPLKVCRTLDGGRTWLDAPEAEDPEDHGIPDLSSYATIIAGSSAPGRALYAATFLGFPVSRPSVVRSLDAGRTWETFGDQSEMDRVSSLAVDPRDWRTVFAGSSGGAVYLSTDAGESWRCIREPHERGSVNDILVRPHGRDLIYIATASGVYVKSLPADTGRRPPDPARR